MFSIADELDVEGRARLKLIADPLALVVSSGRAPGSDAAATVAVSAGLTVAAPVFPDEPEPSTGAAAVTPLAPDAVCVGLVAIAVPRGAVLIAVGFDETGPEAPVEPDEPEVATGALTASE
jgi:hypothetical protein